MESLVFLRVYDDIEKYQKDIELRVCNDTYYQCSHTDLVLAYYKYNNIS